MRTMPINRPIRFPQEFANAPLKTRLAFKSDISSVMYALKMHFFYFFVRFCSCFFKCLAYATNG